MYRSSLTEFPREKIVLAQVDPVQEIESEESEDGREDHDEYDTDSDTETQIPDREFSNSIHLKFFKFNSSQIPFINDDLIFMMGITTRSGIEPCK